MPTAGRERPGNDFPRGHRGRARAGTGGRRLGGRTAHPTGRRGLCNRAQHAIPGRRDPGTGAWTVTGKELLGRWRDQAGPSKGPAVASPFRSAPRPPRQGRPRPLFLLQRTPSLLVRSPAAWGLALSLALVQRVGPLAVEEVEVLELDPLEARPFDAPQEGPD